MSTMSVSKRVPDYITETEVTGIATLKMYGATSATSASLEDGAVPKGVPPG